MIRLCECGCKQEVKNRFIHGHNNRGDNSYRWNGGISIKNGRPCIFKPNHKRADSKGYVFEHILIAEKALGKNIDKNNPIHHIDGDITNNKNDNLLVCGDKKYHMFLHVRKAAFDNCGNKNYRKCVFCKGYDDPVNMYVYPNGVQAYHRKCSNAYRKVKNENNI